MTESEHFSAFRSNQVKYVEIDPGDAETVGFDYFDGIELHHWCKECPHQ